MLVKQEKTYRHTPSASSGDAAEFSVTSNTHNKNV